MASHASQAQGIDTIQKHHQQLTLTIKSKRDTTKSAVAIRKDLAKKKLENGLNLETLIREGDAGREKQKAEMTERCRGCLRQGSSSTTQINIDTLNSVSTH